MTGHARSGKVEHRVDGIAEAGQLLLDAAQSGLEATPSVAHVPKGAFENLRPILPLVPFLHAEQDRVHVDHRERTGGRMNQPFGGRGARARARMFKPDGGWVGKKGAE